LAFKIPLSSEVCSVSVIKATLQRKAAEYTHSPDHTTRVVKHEALSRGGAQQGG